MTLSHPLSPFIFCLSFDLMTCCLCLGIRWCCGRWWHTDRQSGEGKADHAEEEAGGKRPDHCGQGGAACHQKRSHWGQGQGHIWAGRGCQDSVFAAGGKRQSDCTASDGTENGELHSRG